MENKQHVVSVLDVSAVSPQEPPVNISAPRTGSRTRRDIFRLSWLGSGNEKFRVCSGQGFPRVESESLGAITGKGLGPLTSWDQAIENVPHFLHL